MNPGIRRPLARVVLLLAGSSVATAPTARGDDPPDRPAIAGYDRFLAAPDRDPAALASAGRLLFGELNCASCHRGPDADEPQLSLPRKQAPILDGVGSRIRLEHLRSYLANPHQSRPGTTMPDVLRGLDGPARDDTVENLVQFLAETGRATETVPGRSASRAGRRIYAQVGCVACHGAREGDKTATLTSTGVLPLGNLADKYTVASLARFLRDPLSVRPSGRMPSLGLSPDDANGVASYLMQGAQATTPPNVAYRYYEGSWTGLPDLDKLEPAATGIGRGFDIEQARRPNGFAFRFEGVLDIPREGEYTFRLRSDDGSRLILNDTKIFDNDGIHPANEVTGVTRMKPSRNKVVALYFDGGGETELEIEVEGPDLPRQPLGPLLLPPDSADANPNPAAARAPAAFKVDPVRASLGHASFIIQGCASCHTLHKGDALVPARPLDRPLAQLRPEAGCLADQPPPTVPRYDLDPGQRAALRSLIAAPTPIKPSEPRDQIRDTLLAANCLACHRRDGLGGVADAVNAAFSTTQTEMGDEGRIPPGLDGVGGKLTAKWLTQILAEGAKDRPYMRTKMPRFGANNVGHLAALFESSDILPAVPPVELNMSDRRVQAIGRSMVGNTGFSCIACHTFKGIEAGGIQAIDMTRMHDRLRRDWFSRYVVDPQKFRPGTRMPTSWPEGKSVLDSVLDGDTARQVEAIWFYLADGTRAAVPAGVGRNPIPLIAVGEPIVYRNFIQGAGPRAIGVGFPERANLAFDADENRLALVWRGGFIDASRHWTGRGEGFQPPLGDDVVTLPPGPGLTVLADPTSPWPRAKATTDRFRGYHLTPEGRPTFLYGAAGSTVEDRFEGVSGQPTPTLRRTLTVSGPVAMGLALRAAVGARIVPANDGWYSVDGDWKVRVTAGDPPVVRAVGDKSELIVPIAPGPDGGPTRIVEEITW